MCECGCTLNDERYTMPGPKGFMYLVTLSSGCVDCDAPAGVTIQRLKKGTFQHEYNSDPDNGAEPLPFEDWGESGQGVAIATGFLRHEFVDATKSHLIGVSSDEMGEGGHIDSVGAETILEEMFEDATRAPEIVPPAEADRG